jgi:membrane-associated protease RseP (regulator of RpoE activity)
VRLPLILFVLTCASVFFVGVRHWMTWESPGTGIDGDVIQPSQYDWFYFYGLQMRRDFLTNVGDGLVYMVALIGILLAHEFGHFIATRIYRIPATWPLFVPMPFSPIGTMGAVILMDPRQADRRMMFDIGLAGPLAGLVVAVPVMLIGMTQLRLDVPGQGVELAMPLSAWAALPFMQSNYHGQGIAMNQISPLFMAGWVGFLITGLNMVPVGQLDGGHVTYALFGRGARVIARIFMAVVVAVMILSAIVDSPFGKFIPFAEYIPPYYHWLLMAILVLWIGIDHPPTANDKVPLGPVRMVIGALSLTIPLLTFAPALFVR